MFHHQREILRERFVDTNRSMFGISQSRTGAIDLIGRDVIWDLAAHVLRDGKAVFVQ